MYILACGVDYFLVICNKKYKIFNSMVFKYWMAQAFLCVCDFTFSYFSLFFSPRGIQHFSFLLPLWLSVHFYLMAHLLQFCS